MKVSSADTPSEIEHTAASRRCLARPRRWLAGAACGALLAAPIAVASLPAATAATAATAAASAPQAFTPADQFHGVSCPANRSCVAVGWYIPKDGIKRPLAGRWDGSSWHLLFPPRHGGAPGSELNRVSCPDPSTCLAIGDTTAAENATTIDPRAGKLFAERWNGRSWRMVPIADPGRVTVTAVSCANAQSCVLAGFRTTKANVDKAITERWNGRAWSLVTPRRPQPESQLLGVSCPGQRNCYASGWAAASRRSVQRALIEHWNGARWSTQPLPGLPRNSELVSVSCPSGAQCTAVGSSGTSNSHMLVGNFSRGRWTVSQPANKKVANNPDLRSISCAAGRICSAEVAFILNDALEWGFASRGATGGWHFQIPGNVSSDTPWSLSCAPGRACMLVGAKGDNSGRGDREDIGSTLAWHGSGAGFAPVTTPPPSATVGGR